MTDRDLAKDVAKHLDRRQRRRKLVLYGALAGAIALAIVYGTCGHGWGFGAGKGAGAGSGEGIGTIAVARDAATRCTIRVIATGITVDGAAMDREHAVAACKRAGTSDVVVTGDARQGDWDALRAALADAGVEINERK